MVRKLIVLILILIFGLPAGSTSTPPVPYERAILTARTALWKEISSGVASSATVAIMDQGQIVYAEGFGMADREKSIPVDSDTIFNIGSISKAFTATAIMLLVDEGRVALDERVTTYLPDFVMADPRYKNITVRMLLNHSSGLPGTFSANDFGYRYNEAVFTDLLQALSRSHLRLAPGEMSIYTNDGFMLAQLIVERVSGKKFVDFLAERVFKPLGLQHAGPSVGERTGTPTAAFYQPDTGTREPLEAISIHGTGGLSMTAADLVRFTDTFSVAGNKLFSLAARAEINKTQPARFWGKLRNPEISYGLGLDVTDLPAYKRQGIKIIGKSGGTLNYTSMFFFAPEQRLSVAVIEAARGGAALRIALDIMDALLVGKGLIKARGTSVSRPVPPQVLPTQYAAFEGYYVKGGTELIRVMVDRKANRVNLITLGSDETQTPPLSMTYQDGYLYLPGADPSQRTNRFYFIAVGGQQYVVESNPLIGDLIYGEKVKPLKASPALRVDLNGKRWLRRNVRPFEGLAAAGDHIVVSSRIAEVPGYVDFGGILAVRSPVFAGMPVGALRDQMELWLVSRNGTTWAQLSDMLYSPDSVVRPLRKGTNSVTIGSRGYNEWWRAGQGWILNFKRPSGGRVIVFGPDGTPLYDSVINQGEVYIPRGGLVEFAGDPGQVFTVTAK